MKSGGKRFSLGRCEISTRTVEPCLCESAPDLVPPLQRISCYQSRLMDEDPACSVCMSLQKQTSHILPLMSLIQVSVKFGQQLQSDVGEALPLHSQSVKKLKVRADVF
ncbi:Hypothetical predicted protein [Xyrichtys novacula]|uniref:Uncharacterized protein n=1 Tax=Xyrichtys novacula TaxID=13765 RepID=A0AAV1GUD0_XYRNO|nr:Hypothetical predicted protein [Xyrichtys novacula]